MSAFTLETDEECRVIAPRLTDGRLVALAHGGTTASLRIATADGEAYQFSLNGVERLHYQTLTGNGLLEGVYFGAIDQIFTRNEPLSLRLAEMLSPSANQHIGDAQGLVLYASPLIDCELAVHFATLTVVLLPAEPTE